MSSIEFDESPLETAVKSIQDALVGKQNLGIVNDYLKINGGLLNEKNQISWTESK